MEAAVDRRATPGSRIPFEAPIELDCGDPRHPIFGDAVNVGMGGLTVRSSALPDLGQRLTCRFSAEMGDPIEVPGEVVWTREAAGECGVKFLQLDQQSERSLRSRVLGAYVPPPINDPPPPLETGCRRIVFHGVKDPVTVKVLHEDTGGLTIEQELPFLSLDTSILTEEGRAGRIETVELVVDRGVPRMIVDLAYDEPLRIADATIPDEGPDWLSEGPLARTAPAKGTLPGVGPLTMTPDGPRLAADSPTLQGLRALSDAAAEELASDTPEPMVDVEAESPKDPRDITISFETVTGTAAAAEEAPEEPAVTAQRAISVQEVPALDGEMAERVAAVTSLEDLTVDEPDRGPVGSTVMQSEKAPAPASSAPAVASVAQEPFDALMELPTGIWRSLRRAKEWLASNPVLKAAYARMVNWWLLSAWPALLGASQKVNASVTRTTKRALSARSLPGKTTTTKKVPRRVQRRQSKQDLSVRPGTAAQPRQRKIGRWVLGAVLLGVGFLLLVKTVPSSVPAAAETPEAAESATIAQDPSTAAPSVAIADRAALDRGAHDQALEQIAPDSPYAERQASDEAVVAESGVEEAAEQTGPTTMFGEPQVENGRTFVLRMSQAVTGVVGTDLEDGFKVVIPGSLSLDRAGPIASSHELVERSMILNRGDHSELTVRFVANNTPRFRVRARGSSIEVTIEQRS